MDDRSSGVFAQRRLKLRVEVAPSKNPNLPMPMSRFRSPWSSVACAALLAVTLLAGCSKQSPQALVASARQYLANDDHQAAAIELKNALQAAPNSSEARLLLGTALIETGDFHGAEKELRRALELGEPPDRVVPPLARTLVKLGEFKKVVDEFHDADAGDAKRNAELLTALAQARLALRQADAARKDLAKALALAPGYPPALLVNARLKAATADLPGALVEVQAALQASPKFLEAQQLQGDVLAASGQVDAALGAYRKALEIRSKFIPAHAAITFQLLQQKKLDDAGKQLDELKRIAPKHPTTLYLRAYHEYRRNDLAGARQAILLFLKAAPDNPRGLLLASAIEHDAKAFGQSETYLLRVLAGLPGLAPAQQLLVTNYLRSGQHVKAVEALKPLLASSGNDAGTLALAGETYLASGKAPEAEFYFAKAARLDPTDDRKITGLALSHLAQGKTEDAFRELEQAAGMGGAGIRADLALVLAAMQRKEYDKALKAIDALEKKQPDKPLAHNLRGSALIGKRDIEGARKSFERALSIDGASFAAAANLARLDLAEKKPEAAEKRFESVLAKNPKSAESLLALAELKARRRASADEVVGLINKSIGANPTAVQPRVALINYHLATNQTRNAGLVAQSAIAAFPDNAEIHMAAGRAFHAAGSLEQAAAAYGRWARISPKSPAPLTQLADVQMQTKQLDAAADSLRKALALQPDYLEAQRRQVALDVRRNRHPQALETARLIQKQRPKEVAGYVLEGDVHTSSKAWGLAVAAYRNGLKKVDGPQLATRLHGALRQDKPAEADTFAADRLAKYPDEAAFRVYLAESALAAGDFPGSMRHYEALLVKRPDNALWLNNLAYAAGRAQDPKALEYAQKAATLAPENPAILDTLGVLLVEKGEIARGIELLRKATELGPQYPAIRLNLAKSLVKAGQKPAARKELEDLAKLGASFSGRSEVERLLSTL